MIRSSLRSPSLAVSWAMALLVGIALFAPQAAAATPATAQSEITRLLAFVESSSCLFNRNGTWYEPAQAAAHLRDKFEMLSTYGQIDTAEDFIDKAATASSVSGKAYEVRCGTGPQLPSRQWLYDALNRIRACGAGCSQLEQNGPAQTARPLS